MEIDLLVAERERVALYIRSTGGREARVFHPEHRLVELDRRRQVLDGEYDVVEGLCSSDGTHSVSGSRIDALGQDLTGLSKRLPQRQRDHTASVATREKEYPNSVLVEILLYLRGVESENRSAKRGRIHAVMIQDASELVI